MNYTPYARSKNHSQRERRKRKRIMEKFTATIDDSISPLTYFDLKPTNPPSNEIKHQISGTSIIDDDTTYINGDDDRSSNSSCNVSHNPSEWPFSSDVDVEYSAPLYTGSPLSVKQSCIELLKLTRQLNLSKKGVKNLLNSIEKLLPAGNKLPRTISSLLSNASFLEMKRMKFLCIECLTEILSPQDRHCAQRCSLNNKRRRQSQVGELYHANVSLQIRTVAERYINIIKEYSNNYHLQPADIPNGTVFQQLPTNGGRHLTLLLQADGAPLVKMGGRSLWPVQATLVEIPPPLRDHYNSTMILGAWLGSTHPNSDLLWQNIVNQIKVSLTVVFHVSNFFSRTSIQWESHYENRTVCYTGILYELSLFYLICLLLHLILISNSSTVMSLVRIVKFVVLLLIKKYFIHIHLFLMNQKQLMIT